MPECDVFSLQLLTLWPGCTALWTCVWRCKVGINKVPVSPPIFSSLVNLMFPKSPVYVGLFRLTGFPSDELWKLQLPLHFSTQLHSSIHVIFHNLLGSLTLCSPHQFVWWLHNCFIIVSEMAWEEEEVIQWGQSAIVNGVTHLLLFKLLGCINLALHLLL
jgi:hypothetical protein